MDLEKNDGMWRLKKEGSMQVPASIIANEKLIEGMKGDRTLSQLRNVASLKGIIKHAVLMPDGHEGYGFPIGGVAAFDAEDGIISPGGIGYDINCLLPGSKVIDSLGYFRSIESFKDKFTFFAESNGTVLMHGICSLKTGCEVRNAIHFMHKDYSGDVYHIRTLSGTVSLTEDHPLITPGGKRLPSSIKEGDITLVYPFDGVSYSFFSENEKELAIYAKLIGFLTGDGTLTYCGKKLHTTFFGKKDDLKIIDKDVQFLGFNTHLIERTRKHDIGGKKFTSTTAELHVYSKTFAEKLIELGAPVGNKTEVSFRVPKWIRQAPIWIKRLYLAAFFGAELSSPATSSKTGFYSPCINMNKHQDLEEDCRLFLLDLSDMLSDFGISVSKLAFVEKKQGKIRLRLEISSKEDVLELLYSKIGFEYNQERMVKGLSAVLYIRMKRMYRENRQRIRERTIDYKNKGFSLKELQLKFSSKWANNRFIERAYYENAPARAPLSIPSFKEFLSKQQECHFIFGALFSDVIEVKKESYEGKVYDFTVKDLHRFVANGMIVSNCGVRLITTNLSVDEVRPKIKELCEKLFINVPSGVGSEGRLRIDHNALDDVARNGIDWAIEKGYGRSEDKESTEELGCAPNADPSKVSPKAKKRGKSQLGTLGAGNHFLEIQDTSQLFEESVAKSFGLEAGKAAVMIHCGSRGYGHQICSDYIEPLLAYARDAKLDLPDKELVHAPIGHRLGQDYLSAMNCAVNFAFTNRHIIMHWVRETFDQVFGSSTSDDMHLIYDVAHNIAKIEEHEHEGKRRKMVVHRKGATRAFPAGRPELPSKYRDVGQPVIIPGSMGTCSYVLVGKQKGLDVSWGTTCHGAGRTMSRGEAIRTHDGAGLSKELLEQGIYVRATKPKVIAEEAPDAYKNVDDVVASVADAGISDIVAKMKPIGVVKG
jgi:tRNA-splicing ligase RtcB